MAIELQYENDHTGVVVVCTGQVTGDEIMQTNDVINPDLELQYHIWDFSAVQNIKVSIKQIHRIAMQDNIIPMESRMTHAAFIGNLKLWKHLYDAYDRISRVWVGRRTRFATEVFETMEQARDWIARGRAEQASSSASKEQ